MASPTPSHQDDHEDEPSHLCDVNGSTQMSHSLPMGRKMLTADMKRIIQEQRLGFVATADRHGLPNVSPKSLSGDFMK